MSLTDEDKVWLSGQLAKVEQNVATRFEARFERVEARFERVEALFERLEALFEARFERLEARVERLEARVERLEAHVEKVEAQIERVETSLLTEFHKWASPMEMRARSHSAALRALDLEMEAVAERVSKLERPDGHSQPI